MPTWAQLLWCGLFVLLTRPPGWLGARGAAGVALAGLLPRLAVMLYSAATLWMLSAIPLLVVVAFYIMTPLWAVFLVRRIRGESVDRLAAWMARGAVLESATILNSSAGLLIALVQGEAPRYWARPLVALTFAVAQVLFLLRVSKGGL